MTTATKIDGTRVAADIKHQLAPRVAALHAQGVRPGLGTILVGDDPGSRAYVAGKHRDCADVGIASLRVELPATAGQAEIEAAVERLNDDPACSGFIVQLPLPPHVDTHRVLQLIDPEKDADGLHPTNLGKLVLGDGRPASVHAARDHRAAAPARRPDHGSAVLRDRVRHHRRSAARA